MTDIEQRLQKLEDRFLDGEINEVTFKEHSERLLARQAGSEEGGHEGAVNVADSVVRGDIRQTTQSAAGPNIGGDFNFHVGSVRDGSKAELAYERIIEAVLESGGELDRIRTKLGEWRSQLGLTLHAALAIEQACRIARPAGSRGEAVKTHIRELYPLLEPPVWGSRQARAKIQGVVEGIHRTAETGWQWFWVDVGGHKINVQFWGDDHMPIFERLIDGCSVKVEGRLYFWTSDYALLTTGPEHPEIASIDKSSSIATATGPLAYFDAQSRCGTLDIYEEGHTRFVYFRLSYSIPIEKLLDTKKDDQPCLRGRIIKTKNYACAQVDQPVHIVLFVEHLEWLAP